MLNSKRLKMNVKLRIKLIAIQGKGSSFAKKPTEADAAEVAEMLVSQSADINAQDDVWHNVINW